MIDLIDNKLNEERTREGVVYRCNFQFGRDTNEVIIYRLNFEERVLIAACILQIYSKIVCTSHVNIWETS